MATKDPTNFAPGTVPPEAEVPDGRISATRVAFAEWLKVPAASGMECVRVLRRAGFTIFANLGGRVELHRDGEVIEVPLSDRLSPEVLVVILQRARVTPSRFLALIDDEVSP